MCVHCYLDVFILSGLPDGHVVRQTNLIMCYKIQEKVVSYFELKLGRCFRNVGSYIRKLQYVPRSRELKSSYWYNLMFLCPLIMTARWRVKSGN